MSGYNYSTLNLQQLASGVATNIDTGLTKTEAEKRLGQYGPNSIDSKLVSWHEILLRQFKSAFVYLLIGASTISFVLGERLDAVLILLFIVINAALGFYQEYKSEQTVQLLQSYVQPKVKTIRDGKEVVVLGKDLVLGDLVLLETGDIIPADLRFISEHDLTVDESILTGESVQVSKDATTLEKEVKDIYGAINLGFMGTTVVSGVARGIVIATAKQTEMGKISKLTSDTVRESGFEKQLNAFSKFILYLISGTLVVVFISHLFIKSGATSIIELALFSIALAVGVVPEALPLVTTFALSRGAVNLTKKKVVVKRLSSIEDLGSIEILCSDKTGTLTENKLQVADVYSDNKDETLMYGGLVTIGENTKTRLSNNSFDIALMHSLKPATQNLIKTYTKVFEIPFDPARRRNSALLTKGSDRIFIVRGASESILPYATNINPNTADEIIKWTVNQGMKGRRVIAVAVRKDISANQYTKADEEKELQFSGLISFYDPVKKSTKDAVEKAKQMKVTIKILTGDSREVAGAVGKEVGITDSEQNVITGSEFVAMTPAAQSQAVETCSVFARVSPEQKYKIIEALQRKHRVGYLGEGINDAPALKIADVALVVESASDIAREAADIILLSQNLDVIVNGIEEGRKTFVNTVKYIKSTLASNFGNFYAVAFASLLIDYLPMLPIQILLVNLLSDFPMISVATDSVEPTEMKNPKSYDIKEIILIATILGLVSTLFDFIFFGVFHKMGPAELQTNWFIGSILTELLLVYSIRTKRPFFMATTLPSIQIMVLTVVAGLATVIIPLTSFGEEIFKFAHPTAHQFLLVGIITAAYFVTTELAKLLFYRFAEK